MISERENYVNVFVERIRSILGKYFTESLLKTIRETGEASFDVIKFKLEPYEEPEVKPAPDRGE